jgi:hypothetical protein
MGTAIFTGPIAALPYFGAALIAGAIVARDLSKRGWRSVTG